MDQEQGLRHRLGAGQMAMVAVGGSIGTGLLLGSAAALEIAGPGVILSFALAAFITLTVAMALGELSSLHPGAGSFGVYGDIYLNQWAGFIARAGYWAALAISIGAEMVASATYLAFWFPSVPALVWVTVLSVLLLLINLRSVENYARFEYWFAMIKVVTILAFVLLGAGLLLSGRVTPQYTAHGGFLPKGALAPLLAMGFALYTFAGLEFVAVTTGESRSPGEIPRAIKLTFGDPDLGLPGSNCHFGRRHALESCRSNREPFCHGVPPGSYSSGAAHHDICDSDCRTVGGKCGALCLFADIVFVGADRMGAGSFWPAQSLGITPAGSAGFLYGIVVALVMEKWAPKNAFVSILGAALVGMLLSWLVSLAAHVKFRQRLSASQLAALPMRSPMGAWGSALGFVLIIVALLETGWNSHMTLISGAIYVVGLTAAYFLLKRK